QAKDLVRIVTCNIHNMPENYPMRFWAYSSIMWPDVSFLAEDEDGKVVGFVLASIEPNEDTPRLWVGHINSLSVLRPYRRMGLANKLMDLARDAMTRGHLQLEYIQLHVRKSNRAAHSLYTKLGYKYYRTEVKYYGDKEDAYSMRLRI
ncbi:acyl-CoA N-acyltransferase, partial [Melanogaster broomeanus]